MSKQAIKELLGKFQLKEDPERKYFVIFDIDGTLRPDEVEAFDHRHPKIPPETAKQLKELNVHKNIEIVILTARSYIDMFKSNFPKDIIKYCGCGKQILDNEILMYPREEFQKSYDETVILIEILKDIMGKEAVSKIDFLVAPGDFALYFSETDYTETKKYVVEKIDLVLGNSARWRISNNGREIIFVDHKYHYDKGDAAKDIMDTLDLTVPTQVFMFGDSHTDARAMEGLRDYQKDHPDKRLKVCNISIGETLRENEMIDYNFESHEDTIEFINHLYKLIF